MATGATVAAVAAPATAPALAPVARALAELRRRRGAGAGRGLVPGLVVPAGSPGWHPAAALLADGSRADGSRADGSLDGLLDAAKQRWGASPHAAAALAWRSYVYWLVLPVVLGWVTARRVPLIAPADVLVRVAVDHSRSLVRVGLRPPVRVAALPDDPLAVSGDPGLTAVGSEDELRRVLRGTVRDHHLDPLLARIQTRVRLGTRTLLGSLASGVAYGVVRGVEAAPATLAATADTLLSTLDVADLVALDPGPDGPTVRRRTCCLAFTLPEPRICSGCCLRFPPGSAADEPSR